MAAGTPWGRPVDRPGPDRGGRDPAPTHALDDFVGPERVFVGFGLTGALQTPLLIGGSGTPCLLTLYPPTVAACARSFAWVRDW